MRKIKIIILIGGLLILSACSLRQNFIKKALPKVAIDFDCNKSNLQVVDLSKIMKKEGLIGVTGCNQRAAYIKDSTGKWILDSEIIRCAYCN